MGEYIEREAVMQAFSNYVWNSNHSDLVPAPQWNHAVDIVRDYPAADVVPVRHGRWIDMGDFISCSECNATRMKEFLCDYGVARRLDVRTNYCPNCGAKMDKDGDGDV
jgi:hypothetical protein